MLEATLARARALFHRLFQTEIIRRIIKNSSYLLSATGVTMVLGMVQGIFVLRMIGPEGNGLLGAIAGFTNAANQLASFRIYEMVVRYVRLYEERGEQLKAAAVYKMAGIFEFSGAIIAFLLVWLLAPWGANFFGKDAGTAPFWVLYGAVALITFLFESSRGLLQVFDRFQALAIANVVQSVATLILAVYWYFNGGGFMEVLLLYIAGKLVWALGVTSAAIWTAGQQWGRDWWRTPLGVLREDRRSLMTFAFSTNISNTISLVTKDSENLWVAAFLGTEAAGYYKFALSIVGILKLPVTPLAQTTYPELSRDVVKEKWDSVLDTIKRSSRLAAAYSLPLIVLLAIFGRWVISVVYGPEWLPAFPLLLILMVGHVWDNIFFWNRVGLLALNRPIFPTTVNFAAMLIKIPLIFLLVDQFQAYTFAALLSGYYIFTSGISAGRVLLDVRRHLTTEGVP
ncbi:MAG: oligosaccharide flippase family protein [Anaerolineales bacterium]|nr:oligosaccharide flippase family protein [Anaerolineales bacterium]